jgi:Bacterial capsule synthesis protein PGA_cap
LAGETATVFGVGDVFLNVPDGRASLRPLTPLLETAEVVFGNCEGVYSDRPCPSPALRHFMGAPRERGGMLGEAPFHVMTCANNHMMDGGGIGLRDTIALLREQGIAVTGAGEDLAEASSAATIEANGLRVAFLGFCSVFPVGHEARPDRPGIAPLRVRTIYQEPDRSFWEPGIDPLISTEALSGDLDGFRDSIAAARSDADFVVVACHWGYSSRLELLHDYELELARQAVACGADAVLCHHHHSLRGIEMHRGRPIFYGLGALIHHFAEGQLLTPEQVAERRSRFGALASFGEDSEYPLFPFHPDARMTGIAMLELGAEGEIECGFIPALMLPDGSTEPLRAEDEREGRIHDYVRRLSEQSGFDTRFETTEREGWSLLRIAGPGGGGAAAGQVRDRAAAGERHTAAGIER